MTRTLLFFFFQSGDMRTQLLRHPKSAAVHPLWGQRDTWVSGWGRVNLAVCLPPSSVKYKGTPKAQSPPAAAEGCRAPHAQHSWPEDPGSGRPAVPGVWGGSWRAVLPEWQTLEQGGEAHRGGQMNKSHMQFITFNGTVCLLTNPSVCQKIKRIKRTQK